MLEEPATQVSAVLLEARTLTWTCNPSHACGSRKVKLPFFVALLVASNLRPDHRYTVRLAVHAVLDAARLPVRLAAETLLRRTLTRIDARFEALRTGVPPELAVVVVLEVVVGVLDGAGDVGAEAVKLTLPVEHPVAAATGTWSRSNVPDTVDPAKLPAIVKSDREASWKALLLIAAPFHPLGLRFTVPWQV